MIRWLPYMVLLLFACKGPQVTMQEPAPVETRPDWVRSRPLSSMHYIGIGLAPKSRPDHQETAKNNALNDLASEISVQVQGNSLLHTLDRRGGFNETFSSTISTSTSEQLEGYEVVDTWENDVEFWTYYRLSRSEHARIKAERKKRDLDQGLDLHLRALTNLANGDLRGAFDMDLRALLAVKDHWGDADMVELNGLQVPLANEIYNHLLRLTTATVLRILPERCELGYADGFKREMLITAAHEDNGIVRDLPQLPLTIVYPGQSGQVTEKRNTDHEGHARTIVQRVRLDGRSTELVVRLDIDALVSSELDQRLVRPLVASLTVPEKRVPIEMRMPRVFMSATEQNMGAAINDAGVALAIKEELTRNGFRFVDKASESELLLDLSSNTRQGGESNGFYTAFLDVSFSFRDRRSQEVIYEGGRQGVKGVQLDYRRAGMEAYKRAVQDIRNEIVPAMLSALM